MEKYRSSADPSTGVHPFIPAKDPTGVVSRLLCLITLFPLRVGLGLLGVFIVSLFGSIGTLCALLSGALGHVFFRIGHSLGLRLVLFACGVWKYSAPVLERPRTRVSTPGKSPTHGDVVYCNHCSFLDPIYLACAFSPTFAVACGPDGLVRRTSLWGAFCFVLNGSVYVPGVASGKRSGLQQLSLLVSDVQSRSMGPVVLFAEGTTTNAKGVLQFAVQDRSLHGVQTFALGLSYSPSCIETHTVGFGYLRLLGVMTASSSSIRSRIACVAVDSDVQRSVASLAGVPALRLGAEARVRFENHLRETAKGY